MHRVFFQQDGASSHTAVIVRDYLLETFGHHRVISQGRRGGEDDFDYVWPTRSPDCAPNDYYLWGHVDMLVYQQSPTDLYELWVAIQRAVEMITPQQLREGVHDIIERLQWVDEKRWRAFLST